MNNSVVHFYTSFLAHPFYTPLVESYVNPCLWAILYGKAIFNRDIFPKTISVLQSKSSWHLYLGINPIIPFCQQSHHILLFPVHNISADFNHSFTYHTNLYTHVHMLIIEHLKNWKLSRDQALHYAIKLIHLQKLVHSKILAHPITWYLIHNWDVHWYIPKNEYILNMGMYQKSGTDPTLYVTIDRHMHMPVDGVDYTIGRPISISVLGS